MAVCDASFSSLSKIRPGGGSAIKKALSTVSEKRDRESNSLDLNVLISSEKAIDLICSSEKHGGGNK